MQTPPPSCTGARAVNTYHPSVEPAPLILSQGRVNWLIQQGLIHVNLSCTGSNAVLPEEPLAKAPLAVELPAKEQKRKGPQSHYFQFQLIAIPSASGLASRSSSPDYSYRVQYQDTNFPATTPWQDVLVLHERVPHSHKQATGEPLINPVDTDLRGVSMPITADYDTFALLPKFGSPLLKATQATARIVREFRQKRQANRQKTNLSPPNSTTPAGGSTLRRLVNEVIRTHCLGQPERRKYIQDIGHEPAWQATLRKAMNHAINHPSGDLIRHGSEMDNVFYCQQEENIFIAMPDDRFFLTRTWDQVQAFMHVAAHQGYVVYANRTYNNPAGTRRIYAGMTCQSLLPSGPIIPFAPAQAYQRVMRNPSTVVTTMPEKSQSMPVPE
ncbi:MAG: hypothetical protein HC848_00800 [Limnobacter sp.]|nr:hypothetical protein [Limnobacter sp.]